MCLSLSRPGGGIVGIDRGGEVHCSEADPRAPGGDPVEAMASLSKGVHVSGRAKPPSPADAAESLRALMLAHTQ